MPDSVWPDGLPPTRLLWQENPWDSPGKNTGGDCHALLQGIFPTQGWKLCLLCLTFSGWQVFLPLATGKPIRAYACACVYTLIYMCTYISTLFGFLSHLGHYRALSRVLWGFPGGSVVKNLPDNGGNMGLIPGLGRFPGVGNGNPLQCSCLEKFHGQKSLLGCSPCGRKELDMTEQLSTPLN